MTSGYRVALRFSVPWIRKDHIEDVRWALCALDPSRGRVRCGVFTASDGAEAPYRLWLPEKPRAAILLLHGCFDYSGAFDDIAPKLMKHGFACLAYDQRGFGATQSRGRWVGEERVAADVGDAIAFLRGRIANDLPLFVIGESMGGSVAVHSAALHPEFGINGLVLVAPGALASALLNRFYCWMARLMRLFADQSEIVIERNSAADLSPAAAIRLIADPMVLRAIRAELLSGVIAMGYTAVTAARNVVVPTLTLAAANDEILRRTCVQQLHENLKGQKDLAVFADAPHLLLHWRRGGEVLQHVVSWIEQHLLTRQPLKGERFKTGSRRLAVHSLEGSD